MAVFFPKAHDFTVDMGFTRSEFIRSLSNALADYDYSVNGNRVEVDLKEGHHLTIELSEPKVATLGTAFTRNYMDVHFHFDEAMDIDAVDAFLRSFERYFQKGGG